MSPAELRSMTDGQIVEMLVRLRPDDAAVAWLASVISNPTLAEGVAELHRRYRPSVVAPPVTATGKHSHAGTVLIDPERWRSFFWRRRITLSEAGLMCGRSDGWAAVIAHRGRAGYYALDSLACELGITVSQLIDEVGTDDERARIAPCG